MCYLSGPVSGRQNQFPRFAHIHTATRTLHFYAHSELVRLNSNWYHLTSPLKVKAVPAQCEAPWALWTMYDCEAATVRAVPTPQ